MICSKDYAYTKDLNKIYEMTFSGLFEKIKSFQKTNIELDEIKKQLELELDYARKRSQELEAAVENDKVQLEDGEKWIHMIEHQLNLTVTKLIEVEKSLDSSKEENKDLIGKCNELEADLESLKQNRENLKKENEAKNAKCVNVLQTAKHHIGGLSKLNESLRKANLNLVEKKSYLEYKVNSLELVGSKLEIEHKLRCESNARVDKLQKDLADSRAEIVKEKERYQQLLRYGMKLKTNKNKSARKSVFERLAY